HREPHPHGHAQDLFAALGHAFHQVGTAREHRAGADALDQAGLLHAATDLVEDLLAAGLDDVAEEPPRRAPRSVAAHAGDLDLLVVPDHAPEGAAVVALQALGLRHGGPEACRDVAGDVVSADGDHAGVGDASVRVDEQVRGPAADVDDGHADFLLVLADHRVGAGQGLEHDVGDVETAALHAADDVLHAGGRR